MQFPLHVVHKYNDNVHLQSEEILRSDYLLNTKNLQFGKR